MQEQKKNLMENIRGLQRHTTKYLMHDLHSSRRGLITWRQFLGAISIKFSYISVATRCCK